MHVRSPKLLYPSPARQDGPAHVLCARTTNPANVARAIAMMETAREGFRADLLRSMSSGDVALTVLGTGQTPPLSKLNHTQLPAIVLLTDDDDATRLGPDGWPHAARILRWARGAMLHGTGGQPGHYKLAVLGALQHRRLVLVETSSAQLGAWATMAFRTIAPGRILVLQPPDGGVHPVPVPRDQLN